MKTILKNRGPLEMSSRATSWEPLSRSKNKIGTQNSNRIQKSQGFVDLRHWCQKKMFKQIWSTSMK